MQKLITQFDNAPACQRRPGAEPPAAGQRRVQHACDAVTLDLELYDQDPGDDEIISVGKVESLKRFLTPKGEDLWVDMTPAKGVKKGGRVHLCIRVSDNEATVFNNMSYAVSEGADAKVRKHKHRKDGDGHGKRRKHRKPEEVKLAMELFPEGVTLFLTLLNAENIPPMDGNGLADPYVVFTLKDRPGKEKSSVAAKTLSPSWQERFGLNVLNYH